jgi:hypothetical protein
MALDTVRYTAQAHTTGGALHELLTAASMSNYPLQVTPATAPIPSSCSRWAGPRASSVPSRSPRTR